MKALISVAGLRDAIAAVLPVVPARTPNPALKNMHLCVRTDGRPSLLSGTDSEIGVACEVLGVRAEREGSAILSSKAIEVIKTTEAPDLWLAVDEGSLLIRGDGARFKLAMADPAEFPAVEGFTPKAFTVVNAGDLCQAIKRTAFAVDPQATRYALSGVSFEVPPGGGLRLVATDGRQISIADLAATREGDPTWHTPTIVQAKALKALVKAITDPDLPVHLAGTDSKLFVRAGGLELVSRLVEGRWPRYQDALWALCESTCDMKNASVELLRSVFGAAKIATSEESRGVSLQVRAGMLQVDSRSEGGSAHAEAHLLTSGQEAWLSIDPDFMLDALDACGFEAVDVFIKDHKHPVYLQAPCWQYAVMPLEREEVK